MGEQSVGIIGLGQMGSLYLDILPQVGLNLNAVCDTDPNKIGALESRLKGIRTFTDYQQMFDDGVNVVVIATPPKTHAQILKESIYNGLDVLVEKPVCMSAGEAKDLSDIASSDEGKIAVCYPIRFSPVVQKATEFIVNRGLQINRIDISWVKHISPQASSLIGTTLGECTHPIDLTLFLYEMLGLKPQMISLPPVVNLTYMEGEPHEVRTNFHMMVGGGLANYIVSYETTRRKRTATLYCYDRSLGEQYKIHLIFDERTKEHSFVDKIGIYVNSERTWYVFDEEGDDKEDDKENGKEELTRAEEVGKDYFRFNEYPVNKLRDMLTAFKRWIQDGVFDPKLCTVGQALNNVQLCTKILEIGRRQKDYEVVQLRH